MNAIPPQDDPMSRRGGVSPSQTCAAAPSADTESQAVARAKELTLVLSEVYGISSDVHTLRSGNAVVSLHHGLLAYTDGERFWWTGPRLSDSGASVLSSELTLSAAAEQLAGHYAILRGRSLTAMPPLADEFMTDHAGPV
ncbi:hypothetical protein [Streptosporangium sp. NBC_01469]|uniref:hypothetical protein n=1 Tax=Streptosporangium sp. NBC_01469 TaxID=2903898 RepID=UPI002E2D54B1|nr:hypothetical protein [Streptosporangium sp. NBC_01469]